MNNSFKSKLVLLFIMGKTLIRKFEVLIDFIIKFNLMYLKYFSFYFFDYTQSRQSNNTEL